MPRLKEIGVEHGVFWGAGYPHYDCTYPGAVKELEETLATLDRDLADSVRYRNAAHYLGRELSMEDRPFRRYGVCP